MPVVTFHSGDGIQVSTVEVDYFFPEVGFNIFTVTPPEVN
jgi:hypothetical protein